MQANFKNQQKKSSVFPGKASIERSLIKDWAEQLPDRKRLRFIEVMEVEIRGLHEGNIARYKVPPTLYKAWKLKWL